MTRPDLKNRQHQVREEAILDATLELLSEKGYFELNMDEVAARAGLAKATLYQHFSSKDELVVQVVVRQLRQAEAAIDRIDASQPAIKQLEMFLRQGILRRAQMWEANKRTAQGFTVGQMPPKVQSSPLYQEQLGRLALKMQGLVERAKAEGAINAELSTPVIVSLIQRLFQNSYNDLLATNLTTPQELSNTIVSVILNGIQTQHP